MKVSRRRSEVIERCHSVGHRAQVNVVAQRTSGKCMRALAAQAVVVLTFVLPLTHDVRAQSRTDGDGRFEAIADAEWNLDTPLVGRERKCEDERVLVFPCHNVDLLSFLPLRALDGSIIVTDVWGWTDSASGRDFVLVGNIENTAFVEITDPVNPRYLGTLPGHNFSGGGSGRAIKVYKNHALIAAEGGGDAGLQIFDLTELLRVQRAPVQFRETAHYNRFHSAHTLVMDTASGFAYAVGNTGGGETCGGGLHMIDVRNPLAPRFAGCYTEPVLNSGGGVHDAQCEVYRGPDQRYRNREICLNSAVTGLDIVDVTDKTQPKRISIATYPNTELTHQGWLTEDHRYFYLGDEGDQANPERRTRTIILDLADLTEPVVVKEFVGPKAIDHNQFIRGRYSYQSNYAAGLRVLDIAQPTEPVEIGHFDTDVESRGAFFFFSGAWGNYPYFRNGAVAVTSMGDGLFVLRARTSGK